MTQLLENISLAISGLRANKMRALLTMLGIIIGIGSVIGIVMVGDSMGTDILGALETGMATVLVLSGMTSEHDIRKYAFRPDVVLQGVGSIPPVTED